MRGLKRRPISVLLGVALLIVALIASWTMTRQNRPSSGHQSSLSGFGATLEVWNKHHLADRRFAPNSAYDPDPALADQRYNDRYLVTSGSGRVVSYEMRLGGHPDIEAAKGEALKEFPDDTTVLWAAAKSQCVEMEVQSATLGAALADPANPQGNAFVAFETATEGGHDAYDPGNINDLFFALGSYSTAQAAPDC